MTSYATHIEVIKPVTTRPTCFVCSLTVDYVAHIPYHSNMGTASFRMCKKCLEHALYKLEQYE